MKKVKITENTIKRIVERVIFEQEKEEANKQLMALLQKGEKGEDVDKEIKDLLLKNPHLKALQGALTNKGKQDLNKK